MEIEKCCLDYLNVRRERSDWAKELPNHTKLASHFALKIV